MDIVVLIGVHMAVALSRAAHVDALLEAKSPSMYEVISGTIINGSNTASKVRYAPVRGYSLS